MYDCKYLTTFFCISLSQVVKKTHRNPLTPEKKYTQIYIIMHIENVLLLQQNHRAISIHS